MSLCMPGPGTDRQNQPTEVNMGLPLLGITFWEEAQENFRCDENVLHLDQSGGYS